MRKLHVLMAAMTIFAAPEVERTAPPRDAKKPNVSRWRLKNKTAQKSRAKNRR
jgi:hypothetical protein